MVMADSSFRETIKYGVLLFFLQIVTSTLIGFAILKKVTAGSGVYLTSDVQVSKSAFWTFQSFIITATSAFYVIILTLPFVLFYYIRGKHGKEQIAKILQSYYCDWGIYFIFRAISLLILYTYKFDIESFEQIANIPYLFIVEAMAFIFTGLIATYDLKSDFITKVQSEQVGGYSTFCTINICFVLAITLFMNYQIFS